MVKYFIAFSQEAAHVFKWVDICSLQMELVDLQIYVQLKHQCEASDHTTFWQQAVPKARLPEFSQGAVYTLTMF